MIVRISVENLLKFSLVNKLSIILAWEIVNKIISKNKKLLLKFDKVKLNEFINELENIFENTWIPCEIERCINKMELKIENIIQMTKRLNNDKKISIYNKLTKNIKNEFVQSWISDSRINELYFYNSKKNKNKINLNIEIVESLKESSNEKRDKNKNKDNMNNQIELLKENLTKHENKNTNENEKSLKQKSHFSYKNGDISDVKASFSLKPEYINFINKEGNNNNKLEEDSKTDKKDQSGGQGGQ